MAEEHLYYELRMLIDISLWLPQKVVQENDPLRSAVIESFAIHARVLLEFFFGSPSFDDVVAEDYFTQPIVWRNKSAQILGDFEIAPIIKRVNKEVAHLTLSRLNVKAEEKGWFEPGREIHNIIKRALPEFLSGADEKLLGNRFLDTKRELIGNR